MRSHGCRAQFVLLWNVGLPVGAALKMDLENGVILLRKIGGQKEIRTLDTLLTYTRVPGERLQPLGHLSARMKSWMESQF